MRVQFNQLKSGSKKYNKNREDICWIVSFLRGLLNKIIRELPHRFTVRAWLFDDEKEDGSNITWGIRFSVYKPKGSLNTEWDVDVVLEWVNERPIDPQKGQFHLDCKTDGHFPWDDGGVWSLFHQYSISPQVADGIMQNIDALIDAFKKSMEGYPKVIGAVNALSQHG